MTSTQPLSLFRCMLIMSLLYLLPVKVFCQTKPAPGSPAAVKPGGTAQKPAGTRPSTSPAPAATPSATSPAIPGAPSQTSPASPGAASATSPAPIDAARTASPDTAKTSSLPATAHSVDDDDFTPVLLVGAICVVSVMAGLAFVGAIAMTALLIFLFGLVSSGILSASIMIGLYKRSFAAGFKTLLLIVTSIGGIITGIGGMYIIKHIFHLHLTRNTLIGSGLAGGLAGGLLLGIVLFEIIRLFVGYARKKLAFQA